MANVLPDSCVELYETARDGRHADAAALQRRLTPIARLVSTGYGVSGLKFALDRLGGGGGHVRAPLQPADQSARLAIARELDSWRGGDAAPAQARSSPVRRTAGTSPP